MQRTAKNKIPVQLEFKLNKMKAAGFIIGPINQVHKYIRIVRAASRDTSGRKEAKRVKTNMADEYYYGGYSE